MFSHSFRYKICDSVHGFIRFDDIEKKIIDSRPFQRLRYLHQMGVAYLVYPGATHTRFEHSLGVMELATRVYDALMSPYNLHLDLFPESMKRWLPAQNKVFYWRQLIRIAALCHDMGHLPFSHTAEKELLTEGGHEKMTLAFIQSDEIRNILKELGPSAEEDILKLSVREEELQALSNHLTLSPWERVLSKVITEDNFGADRIDYLIRDAHYTGVGYGHFDYHQLIDTVRILPDLDHKEHLTIGISESGIQSIESLWIARYLMYARVYYHSKARLFSHHMKSFMMRHYKEGISTNLEEYLLQTDYRVLTHVAEAATKGDRDALIILKQKEPFSEIFLEKEMELRVLHSLDELQNQFSEMLFVDCLSSKKGPNLPEKLRRFFVLKEDKKSIVPSVEVSQFLRDIPLGIPILRLYVNASFKEELLKRLGTI